jgi:hypothetical protein
MSIPIHIVPREIVDTKAAVIMTSFNSTPIFNSTENIQLVFLELQTSNRRVNQEIFIVTFLTAFQFSNVEKCSTKISHFQLAYYLPYQQLKTTAKGIRPTGFLFSTTVNRKSYFFA